MSATAWWWSWSKTRSSAALPLRATRRSRTSSSPRRYNPSRAARFRVPWSSPTPSKSPKSIVTPAATTSPSMPEIIEQPNNRVDLIFTITEGAKTAVKSVEFIGNSAYSSYRLKDVIKTHESNLLSFISGGDLYDPDRVEADRDLIRRFYLKHGYADVQVVAALTEYDPCTQGLPGDLQDRRGPAVSGCIGHVTSPALPRLTETRSATSRG